MRATRRRDFAAWRASAGARLGFALLLASAVLWMIGPLASTLAARPAANRTDPSIASYFFCFESEASFPDAQTGRSGSHHGAGDCSLCQASCCGAAPLAARPRFVGAAPVQGKRSPWMVADRAAPTLRRWLSHRARAPPFAALS